MYWPKQHLVQFSPCHVMFVYFNNDLVCTSLSLDHPTSMNLFAKHIVNQIAYQTTQTYRLFDKHKKPLFNEILENIH